jgi:hypothetical protein
MKKENRKKIQELVMKEGTGKLLNWDNKIFWHESLVKKALNIIEKSK